MLFQFKWQLHLYYSRNIESSSPTILCIFAILVAQQQVFNIKHGNPLQ